MPAPSPTSQNLSNFVWGIADQLRGVFKPNQYGTLVLPLTILRRLEAVMAPHRELFQELAAKGHPDFVLANLVESRTGLTFYNLSPFTVDRILQEPDLLRTNLLAYVDGFSRTWRTVHLLRVRQDGRQAGRARPYLPGLAAVRLH